MKPVPYPLTVDVTVQGVVQDVTLVNPWVAAKTHGFSAMVDVYMCPLKTGIKAIRAGAVPRRNFINMANLYNGIDFATHDSDLHVISRINGSALNRAFRVGKTPTMGWIDMCQIRPRTG